jgi:hypothetical protein
MVLGDLAAKEPKDNNHARQRSTGRLGGCSAANPAQHLPGEWPFGVFLKRTLSTKGVCSKTAGAACAAGSSEQENSPCLRTHLPGPYKCAGALARVHGVARRAHRGRGKLHFFLFWNTCRGVHTRVQPQRRAGAARAGAYGEFDGQARGRGGLRVDVDREGFGAGPSKPKRPDLDVLPDHRLEGKRAHRGQKNMWRVAQALRCPPSRSAQIARHIARFA